MTMYLQIISQNCVKIIVCYSCVCYHHFEIIYRYLLGDSIMSDIRVLWSLELIFVRTKTIVRERVFVFSFPPFLPSFWTMVKV